MNSPLPNLTDKVARALDSVKDPQSGKGLLTSGRIKGLAHSEAGRVQFVIEAPPGATERYAPVRDAAERAVGAVDGVSGVTAVLTAHAAPPTDERRAEGVPGVRRTIAVASAKGGVGKSTVATNLACALAAKGLRVGLLDLDVYGPSLPTLLGLTGQRPVMDDRKRLSPLDAFGLKAMSLGFVVDPNKAMIWRGAMATQAVRQMIDEVAWDASGTLDVLVLDLPPGTGDVHLTLAQRVPLDGAVIVSTPQEMALADARRGIAMFDQMHVPVLGIVENMSWLETPDGARIAVFGEGGARRTAEALGVPFLGALPIDVALRESADAGAPLVASQPHHPMTQRFLALADATLDNADRAARPAPLIRVE